MLWIGCLRCADYSRRWSRLWWEAHADHRLKYLVKLVVQLTRRVDVEMNPNPSSPKWKQSVGQKDRQQQWMRKLNVPKCSTPSRELRRRTKSSVEMWTTSSAKTNDFWTSLWTASFLRCLQQQLPWRWHQLIQKKTTCHTLAQLAKIMISDWALVFSTFPQFSMTFAPNCFTRQLPPN